MSEQKQNDFKKIGLAFTAVTEVIVYCFVGYFVGKVLDQKFSLYPWLTVVFVFLGLGLGFYKLYVMVSKEEK